MDMVERVNIDYLREWIGKSETVVDIATVGPLQRLSALLDHAVSPWVDGQVPPLGHWFYFLPNARQSELGSDGHPRRGDFLPPVRLPRRMWAGGAIQFHAPIPVGAEITRRSEIRDVVHKRGSSGDLVFVTVEHQIIVADTLAVTERQDIVYRESLVISPSPQKSPSAQSTPQPTLKPCEFSRSLTPDASLLFRFSALTFNAHRIHYDREYTRQVEGYKGLVVQAPLVATLLMDLFLRRYPGGTPTEFSFRGLSPLTDNGPCVLCLGEGDGEAALWSSDSDGRDTMRVNILWQ